MSIQPIIYALQRLEEEVAQLKEDNERLKDQWERLNQVCKQWEKMFAEREEKDA